MSTHVTVEQPRDEASGQFQSYRRPARNEVVQNEGMASFSFPPTFETAEEHLAFYMKAPVSERVLSNARFAYSDMMKSDWAEYAELKNAEHNIQMANSVEYRTQQREREEQLGPNWESKLRDQDYQEWLATQGDREMEIVNQDIEMIVRAGQAYRKSGYLPEEEQAKIDKTRIVISGSGEKEYAMTMLEIKEHYQTSRWIDEAVTDTDLRVARAMERLAAR